MENQISKQEIERIMKTPGKVRGVVFVSDREYILEKAGKEGLEKVQAEAKKMGYPIDYEKANPLEWYPVGLWAISLLAVRQALNWGDKEIFDMGNNSPKSSIVVKMFLKYFVSLKKSYQQSPHYWTKHFTVGKLELPEFHEDEKWLIVRLKGLKIHPICCTLLAGYFLRIAQYVIKSPKITIKETRCMHKGDPYHDFLFTWE